MNRRFATLLLVTAALLSGRVSPAYAQTTTKEKSASAHDVWLGISLNGKRAGYWHFSQKPSLYRGKAAKVFSSDSLVRFAGPAGNQSFSLHTHSTDYFSPDGKKYESWETDESGADRTVTHKIYRGANVTTITDQNGKRITKTIPLRADENTAQIVSPEMVTQLHNAAQKLEVITVAGRPVTAFRIEFPVSKRSIPAEFWLDRDENPVVMNLTLPGGNPVVLHMEGMAREQALAAANELPPLPVDSLQAEKPLPAPRTLHSARFYLTYLSSAPPVTDDTVQTTGVSKMPNGDYMVVVSITAKPIKEAQTVALSAIPRAWFGSALKSNELVPSQSSRMVSLARRIVGTEKDAGRAAEKLSQWVHQNINYDYGYSGNRTATQTLNERKGVCQNYATLLVTLARAAGIPAKYCCGPVYDDGSFYRHAWAKLWVGEWVLVDPTWDTAFADATHITLAEGEPNVGLDLWQTAMPARIGFLDEGQEAPAPAQITFRMIYVGNGPLAKKPIILHPYSSEIGPYTPEQLAEKIRANLAKYEAVSLDVVSPPASEGVLPFLPAGTKAVPIESAKATSYDQKGNALPGTEYLLPDGKRCSVYDAAGC